MDKKFFEDIEQSDMSIRLLDNRDETMISPVMIGEEKGNTWNYVIGYPKGRDNRQFVPIMEVSFSNMPELGDSLHFATELEKLVKEPWFVGRLYTVSDELANKSDFVEKDGLVEEGNQQAIDDYKGLLSRLSFTRNNYVNSLHEEIEKSGEERIVLSDVSSGSEWTVKREALLDTRTKKTSVVFDNYLEAKEEIKRQFALDFNRYGKFLTPSYRREIEVAFHKSLLDGNKTRHPKYEMTGRYTNKLGESCLFDIKAEVYGERVKTVPKKKNMFLHMRREKDMSCER